MLDLEKIYMARVVEINKRFQYTMFCYIGIVDQNRCVFDISSIVRIGAPFKTLSRIVS